MKKTFLSFVFVISTSFVTQAFAQEVAQPKDCKGTQVHAGATMVFGDPQRYKICKNDFGYEISNNSLRFGANTNTATPAKCKKADGTAGKFTVVWRGAAPVCY